MNRQDIGKRVEELRQLIERANRAYYDEAQPFISDREFDEALAELNHLETTYGLETADSPTQRVGGSPSDQFPTVVHPTPMLSLDNTYNEDELRAFDRRVLERVGSSDYHYSAELKFDGAAIRLRYEDRQLVLGATRGDGRQGDDITTNLRTVRDIPLKLPAEAPPVLEVRGEAYMEKAAFVRLNLFREEQGLPPFANPRNSTAGTLKMQDPREVARRPIRFFAFDLTVEEGTPPLTQQEKMEWLRSFGFAVSEYTTVASDIDSVLEVIRGWDDLRHELPYETDGAVIKINEEELRVELGSTSRAPRWAIAYKFQAEQAPTLVESITLQVGRLGSITPVAELKPVLLAGTTIRRASLHNEDEVLRKDIRPGDTVTVEKAGDIIPQVINVVNPDRPDRPEPFRMPEECPACGEKLVKLQGEVAWRCVNPECPPQIREHITHFASRDALDIEGLGTAVVDQLVTEGLVTTYADLYQLEIDQLMTLDRMAKKSATNLKAAIEKSKEQPLDRVIYALGIRFVGKTVSRDLAAHFRSLEALMNASFDDLVAVDSIGPVIAESVISFFSLDMNRKMIEQLREAGLQFKEVESETASSILEGRRFVLTGTLPTMSRSEAAELITSHGGKVSSSVSKNTDFLLAGDSPGSKYDKALKLGVPVLSEEELRELLGE